MSKLTRTLGYNFSKYQRALDGWLRTDTLNIEDLNITATILNFIYSFVKLLFNLLMTLDLESCL